MTKIDSTLYGNSLPVAMEVKFAPATGAKKPFEIWATWKSGTRKNVGSFATEAAAIKSLKLRTIQDENGNPVKAG